MHPKRVVTVVTKVTHTVSDAPHRALSNKQTGHLGYLGRASRRQARYADPMAAQSISTVWRLKSLGCRPRFPNAIRELIVEMIREDPTWGQARVAAELSVKLGIYVSLRTIRNYWPDDRCVREVTAPWR